MSAIKIEELTYFYPDSQKCSLNNLSLQIDRGEFIAVIGANGAGKSTLCYALTGVIPHLYHGKIQGNIHLNGNDLKSMSVAEVANSMGFVMQIPAQQLSGVRYTVFEEIAFGLENRGMEREQIIQRVGKTLKLTGLTKLANRCPQQLSGGQQQKVVLAAVLASEPDIVVLDEPTTFLDPQGTEQIFKILQQLQEEGKTIIIAEQNLEFIAIYADRVIVLNEGQMVLDGDPSQTLTDPILKKVGMDFIRYTKVAELAEQKDLWNNEISMATTFTETVKGLKIDQ